MKATFNLPATLDITDQDPASEVYQGVELLEFDRDAMATGLLIDEFVLNGDFKAIDINVVPSDASIKAQLEHRDANTWVVHLPRPFQLQRINIQSHQIINISMAGGPIAAGYFDHLLHEGHKSVGAAAISSNKEARLRVQAINDFKQSNHWSIDADHLDIFPVVGDKILSESIANLANNANINGLFLKSFAVRARDFVKRSGMSLLVEQHSISIYVRSQPQSLGLGLAPVLNDVPMLDNVTELAGLNLASNQDTVPLLDSANIWLSGLQGFLDENFEASADGEKFKLAVVFRSENPCQFERESSDNSYRLLFRDLSIFPDINLGNTNPSKEQKLVFLGNQWQNFYYQLSLPASSLLHSAVLPFKHTLKKNAYSFVDSPPSEQALVNAKAVELTSEQWAGAIFQLTSAQSVRYLLLPLMAMQSDTVCALEIREDINGLPSGSIITQQSLHLGEVGKRVWMSVPLDDAVPLYSKKLWWLVRTTQGKAMQFGSDNPQGSGITHFSLSKSGGPGSVFRFTPEFSLTPNFAKDDTDSEKMHAFIAQGNNWLALESSEETAGNLNQFDLLLGLSDQTQADVTTITLRLASLLKGNAKLYPPEIIYELVE